LSGAFNYQKDDILVFRAKCAGCACTAEPLIARIQRVNTNVARVYVVDSAGNQQKIPEHVSFTVDTEEWHNPTDWSVVSRPLKPFLDHFFISWNGNYTFTSKGRKIFVLEPNTNEEYIQIWSIEEPEEEDESVISVKP
jgi:hypothetical protein